MPSAPLGVAAWRRCADGVGGRRPDAGHVVMTRCGGVQGTRDEMGDRRRCGHVATACERVGRRDRGRAERC
jgi:hypothetical protein